ncbi:MAG: replication factor C large subunit, partial [Candidatus Woesearchaeota archaeon]|nr:replication factor C large subunit [Candidatus Woesearchaeota archaeon]
MQENNSIPWTRKYQPKKTSEIISQEEAIKQISSFASNYKKQKKKAAIIYGPVGSGKTIAVYAVARELDLEIIEINASDFRNEEQINSVVGASSRQMSLFSKGKIILIDEVDGLSGKEDRGGINALAKLIEYSAFPIICTAVDPFDKKLSILRKKSAMIEFSKPDYNCIVNLLVSISKKENIKFKEDDLKTLARRSGGDIRAAINDLQIIAGIDKEISRESIDELGQREQTETILNAVMKVLKTTDVKIALSAFENIEEKIDEVFLWIDENLPKEYEDPADLARAYDFISKADIMKSRITRWQHWRFLIY